MKVVYLMRHAKSKDEPQYTVDAERPLAKRGKQAAADMGVFMAANDALPDLILTSTARRARDTAERCAHAADYQGEIRVEEALYLTDDDTYLEMLWSLDDTLASVLFVGHNPATESIVEALSCRYVRMPTAALARIEFDIESWAELRERTGRLAWVQLPRELE